MAVDLSEVLVVGISSRALFNLEEENRIFVNEGLPAYSNHQLENEDVPLNPGTGLPLAKALLKLNELRDEQAVEVVVMSRNNPYTGLRILNSLDRYPLGITRIALTGGEPLAPYLRAFDVDLFLSKDRDDVQAAVDAGFAAAQVYDPPEGFEPDEDTLRIAFDYDGVLVSDESEQIYQEKGLKAFLKHEEKNAKMPSPEGPFKKLLTTLATLQGEGEPLAPRFASLWLPLAAARPTSG